MYIGSASCPLILAQHRAVSPACFLCTKHFYPASLSLSVLEAGYGHGLKTTN